MRHLANITAIKDGGRRSVDHGSILKDTLTSYSEVDKSHSKFMHRPHNYLCFVHVCTQLGCDRSTVVRHGSANIGPDRG